MAQCTFIKKNKERCKANAKTGQKSCNIHGKGGAPIQTGRYSKVRQQRLGGLIERHGDIVDPLNLLPEIALLRALLEDYINRYDEVTEAMLAWHSFIKVKEAAEELWIDAPEKPPRILDLADSYRLIAEVGKMVKRVEDVKANNAISQKDFYRLIEQMGLAVKAHVPDDKVRKEIAKDWNVMKY